MELRKLGLTYQQVGDQLGVTPGGAHKMVVAALRKLNEQTLESAADLRRLETERLDQLLVAIASKARQGHLGAVDRVLRIMQRRARLWGLDMPLRVHAETEHEVHQRPSKPVEDMTDEELIRCLTQHSSGYGGRR